MPRFKSREFPKPDTYPYAVTVHESGNRSIVRSDIATIIITNTDGSIDHPKEVHHLGKLTEEEAQPLIKDPKKINLKQMGKRIEKFDFKKFPNTGRQ